MDKEMMISIIVAGVIFVLVTAIIIFEVVWIKKIRKKYMYRWQAHEIVFEIAARSVRLYADGIVQDELSAQNLRICTLRTFIDGTEIKARMEIRGMRVQIEVTAGTTPLQLLGTAK